MAPRRKRNIDQISDPAPKANTRAQRRKIEKPPESEHASKEKPFAQEIEEENSKLVNAM